MKPKSTLTGPSLVATGLMIIGFLGALSADTTPAISAVNALLLCAGSIWFFIANQNWITHGTTHRFFWRVILVGGPALIGVVASSAWLCYYALKDTESLAFAGVIVGIMISLGGIGLMIWTHRKFFEANKRAVGFDSHRLRHAAENDPELRE